MPLFPIAGTLERSLARVRALKKPEAAVFRQVAFLCAGPKSDLSRFAAQVSTKAWHEAAHELMALCHPGDGFMAGLLPDGSAHVRLMLKNGKVLTPIDVYREDSQLSLAVLEAIMLAAIYTKSGDACLRNFNA